MHMQTGCHLCVVNNTDEGERTQTHANTDKTPFVYHGQNFRLGALTQEHAYTDRTPFMCC